MDALLQMLLTEMPSVGGLERQQRVFIWDGKEYPQDPVTYSFGPRVVMLESKVAPYLFRFLPPEYAERQWIPLDVGNETLDLFEQEVNGNEIDWFGHRPDI